MFNFMVQIGLVIVSAIIQSALTPKTKPPKPAAMEDVEAPMAEEGVEIPVIFGTVWQRGPNVLWYGDMSTRAIKSKDGGK